MVSLSATSIRARSRLRDLQRVAIDVGRRDFAKRYPALKLTPIAVLICAFEEEESIGDVLKSVPEEVLGLEVTPVVVVDGGADGTARIATESGAITFVFPVNLGHGVALRVGYDLCSANGAQYVVTLDADGQNDPGEIASMLQPLLDDTADFVVASRRLGTDKTGDRFRKLGVVFFAWLFNILNGAQLSDTSNGYRALRSSTLTDVTPRLEQDQYQTAELLTVAIHRGWRVVQRPTVWHERTGGHSKKGHNLLYGFRYARVVISTWWRER